VQPIYRVIVGGSDVTQTLARHLTQLTVVDQSGTESDRLTLEVADPLRQVVWPAHGVEIDVALGYVGGPLIDMGLYTVDEITVRQPPRVLTVAANAADFRTQRTKERRTRDYDATTLGAVIDALAAEAGWTSRVDPTLRGEPIPHWDRLNESVGATITRLARRYDAVATIKRGHLTFVRRGTGRTASGTPMTPIVIDETQVTEWQMTRTDRAKYQAVEARYRDVRAAEDRWTRAGDSAESDATYRLRQTYPDQASAQAAADAKFRALTQAQMSLHFTLPGNPILAAQSPLILTGFGDPIDGRWILDSVEHRISGSKSGGGYVCRVQALPPSE
jgi:phage protein D